MKYRYLLALLFVLLGNRRGYGQFNSQQLDNSYGLSNSCINSIYRDGDNLMWFGTWDGLNFYDGSTIHVFNYERSGAGKNSLANNVIYQVTGDRNRNIWIGTVEGITKFDKNTGRFSNYFYSRKKAVSNGYTVAVGIDGTVYAARKNSPQLWRYNAPSNNFVNAPIKGLSNFMLLKILFDEQGNLWLLKDKGKLECFAPAAGGFLKVSRYTPVDGVDNVFFCNHTIFYSTKTGSLFSVGADFQKQRVLSLPHDVREITFFKSHYLLAWGSKGIGEYDTSFKSSALLAGSLPVLGNMRVTSLSSDSRGMLWLGTDGNGVIKVSKTENYFGLVREQASAQAFHIPVRAFAEINGQLWIGTKGNGIITLKNWDKKNVSYSSIKSFHTNVDLLDNCVYAIQKGTEGLVYIGSDAPGVTLYNTGTGKFIKWGNVLGSGAYPSFGSVHCVLPDADSSVWLGLNESGLIHLKLTAGGDGKLKIKYLNQYKYNDGQNGPGNNVIYSLAAGTKNYLWVGCRYGGLSLFDKSTQKFTTIKAFSYPGSLSNNDVLSLFTDHRNRLWIGTSFGLNWVDERTAAGTPAPQFKKLYVEDGLPNNTIHAINEDDSGNIWISTNKGLAMIDPASLKIVQFKESDGLQSDEFSDNASWKNAAGTLFFGGIYGFNYFLPANIPAGGEQPRLLLTDLQFAGKNAPEKGLFVLENNSTTAGQHFELDRNDGDFELNIQPIAYAHIQKFQYAFRLKGNDDSWHNGANQEKIAYSNLPPGNYMLEIKWSNGEGVWTAGIPAFSITVKQYIWLTNAAFFIYALVLAAAAWLYLHYRKNKFLLAQELRLEHMLRQKDEKLHQEQLNFFTNITHELQTPLTLILGSLDRYLFRNKKAGNEQGNNFLNIVKQEASRLQYLVNQILEFRKAESGHLLNRYAYVHVSALLTSIADLFEVLADEKHIDISLDIKPSIMAWTDRDKVEKIAFNVISNAIKHTANHQHIMISVTARKDTGDLEMVTANSGCQLNDIEVERLFDRFYVTDGKQNNKNSTGIGLAFTSQMVNSLGGSITAKCEGGWMSFKILLPLNEKAGQTGARRGRDDTGEQSSDLLAAITAGKKGMILATVADNNKRSLIKSFEEEHKKSILVVEDDQLIRYLLQDILHDLYIVYEAGTGVEALELIRRTMPDIVISDIMMPDMNGLELCSIIKNTTETCAIPFVLLSARTSAEHETEGYGCGADAYIPKPFQAAHLLVRVEKLLEYREKMHRLFVPGRNLITRTAEGLEKQDKDFIEQVTRVISENLEEELDSGFLEKAFNMGRMVLYRRIKTFSDMTPTELIRHIRLQKASALLLGSDLTVSEIFYRTGFNNKSYFFREFKKLYNCSPNDYRQHHRLPNFHKN